MRTERSLRLTRRRLLSLLASGSLLAACGGGTTAQTPTTAPATAPATVAATTAPPTAVATAVPAATKELPVPTVEAPKAPTEAPTKAPPTAEATVEVTAEASNNATTAPAMTGSGEPGMACLASTGFGVSCLGEDGWEGFTSDNSKLGGDYIGALAVCPDNSVLAAESSGLSRFDGKKWTGITSWGSESAEAVACDKDNNIWVAHFKGVSFFDGKKWTRYEAAKISDGSDNELVYDVDVSPKGEVWALTPKTAALFDGKEWKVFKKGEGFDEEYFFNDDGLALDSKGNPWVATSSGLLSYEDGKWTSYDSGDFFTVETVAIDQQDHVWIGTYSDGVVVFDGKSWETKDIKSDKLSSNHIQAIRFDQQGRAWVGTGWGLNVYDGQTWQAYHMSTADLSDEDISDIAVLSAGPALPKLAEKKPGTLSGTVVKEDKTPLAEAAVEVCVEPLGFTFDGDTPCSEQPYMKSGKTNDKGEFTISDLPPGRYIVTMETDKGKWAQLTGEFSFGERVEVTSDNDTDLGTLTIKPKKE